MQPACAIDLPAGKYQGAEQVLEMALDGHICRGRNGFFHGHIVKLIRRRNIDGRVPGEEMIALSAYSRTMGNSPPIRLGLSINDARKVWEALSILLGYQDVFEEAMNKTWRCYYKGDIDTDDVLEAVLHALRLTGVVERDVEDENEEGCRTFISEENHENHSHAYGT